MTLRECLGFPRLDYFPPTARPQTSVLFLMYRVYRLVMKIRCCLFVFLLFFSSFLKFFFMNFFFFSAENDKSITCILWWKLHPRYFSLSRLDEAWDLHNTVFVLSVNTLSHSYFKPSLLHTVSGVCLAFLLFPSQAGTIERGSLSSKSEKKRKGIEGKTILDSSCYNVTSWRFHNVRCNYKRIESMIFNK